MGFAQDRVDWALYATGNKGLQPTLDHLEANQDNPVPTDYKSAPTKSSTDHDVSSDARRLMKIDVLTLCAVV